MAKVLYNLENMEKCICCICKVQRTSDCPKKRTKKIQKLEANGIDTLSLLDPEEFPWLYCVIGKAICNDLKYSEECICKKCMVWKEYNLEKFMPDEVYCREGPPK